MTVDLHYHGETGNGVRPLRVLAIGPHVDDVEIGCGATLLRLLRYHEAEVHVRVFSDHYSVPRHQDRAQEGTRAAERMGYASFECYHYVDTEFPQHGRDIQTRLAGLREELGPDLVLGPSDEDTHQDHVTLARAIQREFRYGESFWAYEISQFGTDYSFLPNLYVDVSLPSRSPDLTFQEHVARGDRVGGVVLEDCLAHEKIDVLQSTMITQISKPLLQAETLASIMRVRGMHASREVRYAEAFRARTVLHAASISGAPDINETAAASSGLAIWLRRGNGRARPARVKRAAAARLA